MPGSPPALRVAVDATALLDAHPTGVGHVLAEYLRRIAERSDVEAAAFALSWRGRRRLAGVLPRDVTARSRPAAAQPLRRIWMRLDVPAAEWWTGRVEVVHGPNFVVPPTRSAAQVVTVHDLTCLRFPQLCTADTLQYPRLIERAVRRGAWVHTPSEAVAGEVREAFAVPPERVVPIHHGAPAIPGADAGEGRRLAGGDRFVLSLGTVEPRKDLPTLVRAFDALAQDDRSVRLVVAGPDGWGVEDMDRAVRAARHGDRIVRIGWVDDAQRASLLRAAAVFAYPSVYEGFGLPPLEAMAAGTPVVATRTGPLPEVLGDAALLVEPRDAEALASALGRALDEASTRAVLIERGRRNVGRFSWDRATDALVDLYRAARDGR